MKLIENLKILVVGDMMLDQYILGEVERISPEAPVPIVKVTNEYHTLGGCGNVARNIRELGANVDCLFSVGWDNAGEKIEGLLDEVGIRPLTVNESKVTTVKERVIADERKIQMIRVDKEDTKKINHNVMINRLEERPLEYDIVVISDYAKGVITKPLMDYFHMMNYKMIVDPKPVNKDIYGSVYMLTPNEKECKEMGGCENLIISDKIKYILETRGKEGMTLYDYNQAWDIEAEPVEVYNVSGAGDTVVAVMAVCISMGYSPVESANISNRCAAYVVTQPGTTVVPKNIFINNLDLYYTEKNNGI